jgi:hypothetical protein
VPDIALHAAEKTLAVMLDVYEGLIALVAAIHAAIVGQTQSLRQPSSWFAASIGAIKAIGLPWR